MGGLDLSGSLGLGLGLAIRVDGDLVIRHYLFECCRIVIFLGIQPGASGLAGFARPGKATSPC